MVKFLLEGSLDDRMQDAQDRKRQFIVRALDGEDGMSRGEPKIGMEFSLIGAVP